MPTREELNLRLTKIHALFVRAATDGERAAAWTAFERVEARLEALNHEKLQDDDEYVEYGLNDRLYEDYDRRLFVAVARFLQFEVYYIKRACKKSRFRIVVEGDNAEFEELFWQIYMRINEILGFAFESIFFEILRTQFGDDIVDAKQPDEFKRHRRK